MLQSSSEYCTFQRLTKETDEEELVVTYFKIGIRSSFTVNLSFVSARSKQLIKHC